MKSLLALAAVLALAAAPALAQHGRIVQKPAAQAAAPAKKGAGSGATAFQPTVLPGPPRADQMGTLRGPAGPQTKGFNPGLKPLYGVGRAPTRR